MQYASLRPVTDRAALRTEVRITTLLLCWSFAASGLAIAEVVRRGLQSWHAHDLSEAWSQLIFLLASFVVMAGSWAYLMPRRAYYKRALAHAPVDAAQVKAAMAAHRPVLTILVPSYKEELDVVRQTLMSAALQDVRGRRIVLLLDDPPHPKDEESKAALHAMRALPGELQRLFDGQAAILKALRDEAAASADADAARALVTAHQSAAAWFEREIFRHVHGDHTARWLAQAVLEPMRQSHLASVAVQQRTSLLSAFDDLIARFELTFTSFERKRYANLSHEPNKAMNLNAYLALMGGSYHEVPSGCGRHVNLLPAAPDAPDAIELPDADIVLTLDADSLLLPGYAERLAEVMLRPGNERLAVIQTPYSAVPGATGLCERVAGAQTDIQYLMHQGFTAHDATFWVGANALLRKKAIEDIATVHVEDGKWVKKYIHDRTVIEDTESSIDLVDKGWRLFNYPERLAYSATPPDFGSLLIQRRRWADGGLIILPKALRYLVRDARGLFKPAEAFLRVHYLSSVATVNFAFLLLMFGPFAKNISVYWIPLAMLAYMVAYARDLRHCGYSWGDYPRVYALNLVLLPVNLGGTLRSLYQAVTGKRAAFARTPKVIGRTAVPGGYVLVEFMLLALAGALAVSDLILGHWVSGAMSAVYAAFMAYGIGAFMGWRPSLEDIGMWLKADDAASAAKPAPALQQAAEAGSGITGVGDVTAASTAGLVRREEMD